MQKSRRIPAGAGGERCTRHCVLPSAPVELRSVHVFAFTGTTATSIRPARRACATTQARGAVTPPRIAPIVRRPQVTRLPRSTLRRRHHVIQGRPPRMPTPQPVDHRATAQPAHRARRAHQAEQGRILGGAQLRSMMGHPVAPLRSDGRIGVLGRRCPLVSKFRAEPRRGQFPSLPHLQALHGLPPDRHPLSLLLRREVLQTVWQVSETPHLLGPPASNQNSVRAEPLERSHPPSYARGRTIRTQPVSGRRSDEIRSLKRRNNQRSALIRLESALRSPVLHPLTNL